MQRIECVKSKEYAKQRFGGRKSSAFKTRNGSGGDVGFYGKFTLRKMRSLAFHANPVPQRGKTIARRDKLDEIFSFVHVGILQQYIAVVNSYTGITAIYCIYRNMASIRGFRLENV